MRRKEIESLEEEVKLRKRGYGHDHGADSNLDPHRGSDSHDDKQYSNDRGVVDRDAEAEMINAKTSGAFQSGSEWGLVERTRMAARYDPRERPGVW